MTASPALAEPELGGNLLLRLRDGSRVSVRPVNDADEEPLLSFLEDLCLEARRMRFFSGAVDLHSAAHWAAVTSADRYGLIAQDELGAIVGHAVYILLDPERAEVVRQLAMLGYQGPISLPFLGLHIARPMARAILRAGRGADRLAAGDLAVFSDNLPPAVTVAMYRTFLTHEVLPIARGLFAEAILDVPTTLVVGARDLVTRGMTAGPVEGQPKLDVEEWADVGHWLPEQRSLEIVRWAESINQDRVT